MERTRLSSDTIVVGLALAVTALAILAYAFLPHGAVPAAGVPGTGPPPAPPTEGGPTVNPSWPPLGSGSSAVAPVNNATFDLRLSATPDRAVYEPGQSVNVNVTIANVGNTTENLTVYGCWVAFFVEDETGAVVYDSLHHVSCTFAITTLSLPPGASFSHVFTWDQVNDNGTAVPPSATYTLVPRLSGGNEDPLWTVSTTILVTGAGPRP